MYVSQRCVNYLSFRFEDWLIDFTEAASCKCESMYCACATREICDRNRYPPEIYLETH